MGPDGARLGMKHRRRNGRMAAPLLAGGTMYLGLRLAAVTVAFAGMTLGLLSELPSGHVLGLDLRPAAAVSIELKGDAGIDRIERQRRAARGQLPLPGTPDLNRLDERIAIGGFSPNAAIFLRAFKDSSTLEVWMQKGERFALFASYPICAWDGTFGPKLVEGDRQSPEGFYSVGENQLRWRGRYHRAFDLNYPNLLDTVQGRSGSAILIHGACSTVGCFAMTNPVIDELFALATRAMAGGQRSFGVHVFPFPMTNAALEARKGQEWEDYWRNLKIGYDLFEASRVPPQVGVCNRRYSFEPGNPSSTGGGPLGYRCGMWMAGGGEVEAARVAALPLPSYAVPAIVARARNRAPVSLAKAGSWRPSRRLMSFVSSQIAVAQRRQSETPAATVSSRPGSQLAASVRNGNRTPVRPVLVAGDKRGDSRPLGLEGATMRGFAGSCNQALPACRKFLNLRSTRVATVKRKAKVKLAAVSKPQSVSKPQAAAKPQAVAKPRKVEAKRKKS